MFRATHKMRFNELGVLLTYISGKIKKMICIIALEWEEINKKRGYIFPFTDIFSISLEILKP